MAMKSPILKLPGSTSPCGRPGMSRQLQLNLPPPAPLPRPDRKLEQEMDNLLASFHLGKLSRVRPQLRLELMSPEQQCRELSRQNHLPPPLSPDPIVRIFQQLYQLRPKPRP